jgi:hypothetical protein
MPVLQRAAQYFTNLRAEETRRNHAAFGRRSRSAASNMYPYLNTTSPSVRAAMNPRAQGSAASRMYPHLPSQSASRVQQPKPRVRMTHARRIYGDLE